MPYVIFIEIGRGRLEAYGETCETCRVERVLSPYKCPQVVDDGKANLDTLIERTNPSILQTHADRLELEKRAASGAAKPPERTELIFDTLVALAPEVQARSIGSHYDVVSGSLFAVTVLAVLVWFGGLKDSPLLPPIHEDMALYIGLGIGGAGMLAMLVSQLGDVRRFTRRRILPRLARSLFPLKPSEAEVADALARLRAAEQAIGRELRASEVISAVRNHDPDF